MRISKSECTKRSLIGIPALNISTSVEALQSEGMEEVDSVTEEAYSSGSAESI